MIQGRNKYWRMTNNILTFSEDGRKEKELGAVKCLVTRLSDIFFSCGMRWGARLTETTLIALLL